MTAREQLQAVLLAAGATQTTDAGRYSLATASVVPVAGGLLLSVASGHDVWSLNATPEEAKTVLARLLAGDRLWHAADADYEAEPLDLPEIDWPAGEGFHPEARQRLERLRLSLARNTSPDPDGGGEINLAPTDLSDTRLKSKETRCSSFPPARTNAAPPPASP